jgi:CRISPR system Cascade subunit CasB
MTAPPAERVSLATLLTDDVVRRVSRLQHGYLQPSGAERARAQAALAILRGADPADPTTHPEAWPFVAEASAPELSGSGDEPTPAERARHCALVLYAIHQQSGSQPVHVRGVPFARAVRQLANKRAGQGEEFDQSVRGRFDQVILAATWRSRAEHLRALVRLMRVEGIGFDYADLARDLYRLARPGSARHARVAWARGFYTRPVAAAQADPDSQPQNDTEGAPA